MFLPEHGSREPLAIGESLFIWTPSCNRSISVEIHGQCTTSDSSALLLGKALDSSGVIAALEDHLVDLLETTTLHRDPLWQLACSDVPGDDTISAGAAVSSHAVSASGLSGQ